MPLAALVFGSGFDARDLVVYVLAVASAVAVDTAVGCGIALAARNGTR